MSQTQHSYDAGASPSPRIVEPLADCASARAGGHSAPGADATTVPGVLSWADMTTAQRVEAVARLRAEGIGRREIAAQLGTTRNAVVGLCYRLAIHAPSVVKHPLAYDRDALAARMRVLVAGGNTIESARRIMGIGSATASRIANDYKIRPAVQWRAPKPKPSEPMAPPAPPNMKLTPAQRAHLEQTKKEFWARKTVAVAPPSDAEAAAAVERFLAMRAVTVCPPAFAAPVNNGRGL